MSLVQFTEQIMSAVARSDFKRAAELTKMAVVHLPPVRRARVARVIASSGEAPANEPKLKHWASVVEPRAPWTPTDVSEAIARWLREVRYADALVDAGERVLPLLLGGETRCGKTSSLCAVAATLGLRVKRLSLADAVGSHLGESAQKMRDALTEARTEAGCLWLIDELDAIAFKRRGEQAADQERAHAVGSLLAEFETFPPGVPLVATSNHSSLIDPAVLGRFVVVDFPKWSDLNIGQRRDFAVSHGYEPAGAEGSYAAAVKAARLHRVETILSGAEGDDSGGEPESRDDAAVGDSDERPSETPEQRALWLGELRSEREKTAAARRKGAA